MRVALYTVTIHTRGPVPASYTFCEFFLLTGMAASSRRRQRYSPMTVVTTRADALITHHIQFVGKRPPYSDCEGQKRHTHTHNGNTYCEERVQEEYGSTEVKAALRSLDRVEQRDCTESRISV